MSALLSSPATKAPGQAGSPLARQRRRLFWPFVGPALVLYTALFVVPVGATIWISLNKWPGAGPMEFRGLGNYTRLLTDDLFLTSFGNTLLLLFVVGGAIFVLAFAMSLFLRDMAGKSFARSVIFIPHLINALVFGVLAGFIFNPDGLLNSLLGFIGVEAPLAWLARENLFPLIMITMLWMTVGYYTTILMSGVDRIPPYFFEDAALAGANAFQRLRHVILPLTWDVFAVCAVLWTISAVKIFEIVWIFGGGTTVGSPPHETWTAAVYTYATAFGGESIPSFGAAAAAAVLSLLLVSVLVVLLRRVTRREAIEF
ncbi:carbohydrate ABC transporter permease [Georgenia subflava]|uniref:Sugar ABC transporter permease n=1 Tax=Georgenia subflava TaxID=1622177 RepID=A0A6N7EJ92_9MICO|nr:sugar ABC transporter permease [Georgenia subflava]MPV38150.1 sugar ABC transporter permease [Georgenia subflava]